MAADGPRNIILPQYQNDIELDVVDADYSAAVEIVDPSLSRAIDITLAGKAPEGPPGPTGPTGPTGPSGGPTGPTGPTGPSAVADVPITDVIDVRSACLAQPAVQNAWTGQLIRAGHTVNLFLDVTMSDPVAAGWVTILQLDDGYKPFANLLGAMTVYQGGISKQTYIRTDGNVQVYNPQAGGRDRLSACFVTRDGWPT